MNAIRRRFLMLTVSALVAFSMATFGGFALGQTAPRPGLDKMMGAAKAAVTDVTVGQAAQMGKMFPNMVWVDVRTDGEWAAGHIPGAVHLNRGLLEFRAESAIPDKGTKVLVYCKSGGRGTLATKTLLDMGYTDVRNMAGGYTAWEEAGQPIMK